MASNFINALTYYSLLRVPPPEAIRHIPVITDASSREQLDTGRHAGTNGQQLLSHPALSNQDYSANIPSISLFDAGLPPIPSRPIQEIQDGEFIDMPELTINRLSTLPPEDTNKASNIKR